MPVVPRRNPGITPTAPIGSALAPEATPQAAAFGVPGPGVDIAGAASSVMEPIARRANQLAVLDADNQLAQAHSNIEQHALNTEGANVLGAWDAAKTDFEKSASEIESTLSSPLQKQAFRNLVMQRGQSLYTTVQRHMDQQFQKHDDAVTKAAIEQRVNSALANYQDPQAVNDAIQQTRAILSEKGKSAGWGPEITAQQIADQTSRMHVGVIGQMLDARQDRSAQQYFDKNKDQIVGSDRGPLEKALEQGSTLGEAQRVSDQIIAGKYAPGLVEAGNVDLTQRPHVKNADGSVSTVRSISIEEDGKAVLIPTVVNGKVVSDADAIAHYEKTGEHLGTFDSEASANAYAQRLHEGQARTLAGGPQVTATEALAQAESITDPRVREQAVRMVDAHFSNVDRAQRLDREAATANLIKDMRANGGTLNTGSLDWQLINGHPEGEHVLDVQREIQHPKEIGDTEKYNSYIAKAFTSPATKQELLDTPITDILADGTLSSGQKNAIINQIRGLRRENVSDLRRQQSEADAEAKRLKKIVDKAIAEDDTDTREQNEPLLFTAQQKATVLKGQIQAAQRADRAAAPTADAPDAPASTPLTAPAANPFGLSPARPLTPAMLTDIQRKGQGYADYLRAHGYAVPAVIPKSEPKP
jgi:predicted GIY-YIG superfamily endonuclease